MKKVTTDLYVQLSDAEWARIEMMVRKITNERDPNVKRPGRKRADIRMTTNAVLHHITTCTGLGHVGIPSGEYPSTPTRRRLLDLLVDSKTLPKVFAALADTRPDLAAQYQETKLMKVKYQTAEFQKRTEPTDLSWGVNLAPLPWFNAVALEND